jgi:hypothetical protein
VELEIGRQGDDISMCQISFQKSSTSAQTVVYACLRPMFDKPHSPGPKKVEDVSMELDNKHHHLLESGEFHVR